LQHRGRIRGAVVLEPGKPFVDCGRGGTETSGELGVLERARETWRKQTLLAVTHDVSDTLDLPRVLVIERGQILEDGDPKRLAQNPQSRYRQLLDAEDSVRHGLWSSAQWRRVRMGDGKLTDWVLGQREIMVTNAEIDWIDDLRGAPPLALSALNFRLRNTGDEHAIGLLRWRARTMIPTAPTESAP
jgi:hypothetical protein